MAQIDGLPAVADSPEMVVQRSSNEAYTDMGSVCSADGRYRYYLWREWDGSKPTVGWIMANPSVGDGYRDDQTLRLVRGFSERWGFGRLVVANLFAFISTVPTVLDSVANPVGPHNDSFLCCLVEESKLVVGAWGDPGDRFGRPTEVVESLGVELHALSVLKSGNPGHPIGKPKDAEPGVYRIDV